MSKMLSSQQVLSSNSVALKPGSISRNCSLCLYFGDNGSFRSYEAVCQLHRIPVSDKTICEYYYPYTEDLDHVDNT